MADGAGDLAPGVMTEYLTDEWGFFIRSSRRYERFRSPYQAIEVHETEPFGKLFRLDGHFMTSEQDEFFYHENLVHLPGITHPAPERALIVGGGDGGSAEELLKYPSMKKVTLAEIDMAVVDIARKYLADVHKGSLDDPRLDLRIGDGFAYLRETPETFDLIVLDLTDPGGPSLELYTPEFYRACASRLTSLGPMARGAKPSGARRSVAPRMTMRTMKVRTASQTKAATREYWPGEWAPKPLAAKPPSSKPGRPLAM